MEDIFEKVEKGERLDKSDGIRLFKSNDITTIGKLANLFKTKLHGNKVFYVINRHINYSNLCMNGCAFCAFGKPSSDPEAFQFSLEEIAIKLEKETPENVREIHIVGGCHPTLRIDYYENLIKLAKAIRPKAVIKAFTAVEIENIARIEKITPEEVLDRFKKLGLEMLPGGGAEIFSENIRKKLCPKKISGSEWLRIHKIAHQKGIKTNATMLFGHIESVEDRLDHLLALRELQDETGGFTCFIPLPFQAKKSPLKIGRAPTAVDILKTIAISRLLLDNIPHIKAYWIMLTLKLAQLALFFGADDLDGTVVEEKIGHMAGAESEESLTREQLEELICSVGLEPVERNGLFQPVVN